MFVYIAVVFLMLSALPIGARAQSLPVNEAPAVEGEWGFHPAEGESSARTPPAFVWRPQAGAASYTLQASRDAQFARVDYQKDGIAFNVHTPPRALEPGTWYWRFRFTEKEGRASAWSTMRRFTVSADSVQYPIPDRGELLARVPKGHPRLFVRLEQMPELRRKAQGELKPLYEKLLVRCEELLKKPVSTEEPARYPEGTVRLTEEWRTYWKRQQQETQRTLEPAALLGFTYQLSGEKRFGQEARRLLLGAADWDPEGASGYLYNDEAGMPYNYLFSRTYTFIHDLLTEPERDKCRKLMRIRGEEMYHHLYPSHLWQPYRSHQNRAWHFLGEVAIAFQGEIPEAQDWLWFSTNVFANVYPVWNDSDGGWHEGLAYWRSYMTRFAWWADIMKAALDIDAYDLPFFSQIGFYPMYLQPPGTRGGGFGDQAALLVSSGNVTLMRVFAAQAQNPYWQWYVDAHGETQSTGGGGYIEFIRAALLPPVTPKPPDDLPTSRAFRGIGQAFLNSDLTDAKGNISLLFKSSPFGTMSHGYESQNAFQLSAFGQRLFVSSGERDLYGSDHHKDWMWATKSVNSITVGGKGQIKHSPVAVGRITAFQSSEAFDYVQGEAGKAYDPALKRFTRSILFVKPELIVILDRLESETPQTFEWLLHAPMPMTIHGQEDVRVENGNASARVSFLAPAGLKLSQTDKFSPPPRERIKLTQYHLTARTAAPARKQHFITVLRPHRTGESVPEKALLETVEGGYILRAALAEREVAVYMKVDDTPPGTSDMSATLRGRDGRVLQTFPAASGRTAAAGN